MLKSNTLLDIAIGELMAPHPGFKKECEAITKIADGSKVLCLFGY